MPSVRKFKELKVPGADRLDDLEPRGGDVREITKPELPGLGETDDDVAPDLTPH
jgi:hypothetical protein